MSSLVVWLVLRGAPIAVLAIGTLWLAVGSALLQMVGG